MINVVYMLSSFQGNLMVYFGFCNILINCSALWHNICLVRSVTYIYMCHFDCDVTCAITILFIF